ncbi:MAG: lipocalin family protein [Desulfomonile sp.]|jgi:Lipocalin-like domain
MIRIMKPLRVAGACAILLFCASCFTMSLPKSATLESGSPASKSPVSSGAVLDKGLVDKWELLYQVNDKGGQERPRESTRTLIEFTDNGRVVFNRMDKETTDSSKSRSGQFSLVKDEISITDDAGNTVQWPYQITGDTLVLVMPEVKKKFYWQRVK